MISLDRLRRTLGSLRLNLAEREVLHCEQQVLALISDRPAFAGRPLGHLPEAVNLQAANERRLGEIKRALGGAGLAYDAIRRLLGRPRLSQAQQPVAQAIAVPFEGGFSELNRIGEVAAIAHLFHAELAEEVRLYLEMIPVKVDLYVSTDTEDKRTAIFAAFRGWDRGALEVRLAPNRGRDIAPKLIAFREVYSRYEIVLHAHGKVSPHDSNLRLWRYFIYEILMGGREIVASILAAFEAEPTLGMVAPEHFMPVRESIGWGPNLTLAQGLSRSIGVNIDPAAPLDFPSGSMFWARSAALKPLLDLELEAEDFPEEAGQQDQTLAHAIERLYFLACAVAGFEWIRVTRRELACPVDPAPRLIADRVDFARALKSLALRRKF